MADKRVIIAGSILLLIVAGAFLLYGNPGGGEKVLKVLNYSEYIDPEVLKIFEEETGIKVVYDEFEAAEEAWPKLKAGGAGYDLIIIAHTHVKLAIEQGVVQPLDKGKIPNLANLDPVVAGHPADPEQRYAVPYMWGTTGIAYVEGCVEDPPKSWAQFLSPDYLSQYDGKVSLLSEFTDVVEAAMIALDIDPTDRANWNDDTAKKVEDLLLSIKPYLAGFYGASQYMPALVNEEICLAQAWNGDVLVAQEDNENIQYVNPEDGTIYWVDFMVIPRDAENVEAAHMFINFLLRPDIAARNVKAVWYAASIKKSLLEDYARETGDQELMEILEDPAVYPPAGVNLVPSPVLDKEMSRIVEQIRLHVLQPTG
ncbi:MAG: spermidine/putrescine ABC transporter substrate-binding protein [Desulfurococcales archaeon]|nr:spermidine/putrescine ABC transporter substrate-binding protein [Desulfurococcales archaeon]